MIREVDVAQLMDMGFGESQVREALTISGGNLDLAINYLLTGPPSSSTSFSDTALVHPSTGSHAGIPRPSSGRVGIITTHDTTTSKDLRVKADGGLVQCHLSQYSFDLGRSACTCIALTAATKFLQQPNITTDFLEGMLTEGISNYTRLMRQSLSVEHLSAEEVLQQQDANTIFSVQILPGGIRQGLLSHDFHHPMGFQALLEGIRFEQPPHQWMAILITKTPETVLVCFPPPAMGLATTTNPTRTTMTPTAATAFWLIDSHPRPQLGVESAYAKLHPSLDTLCLSLQAIFPCTELGPDIPEMMAMMYNSFDLYPLLLLPSSSSTAATTRTIPSTTRTIPSTTRTVPSTTRTIPSTTPPSTLPLTAIPPTTTTTPSRTITAATTPPPPPTTTTTTTKRPKKQRNRRWRKK